MKRLLFEFCPPIGYPPEAKSREIPLMPAFMNSVLMRSM